MPPGVTLVEDRCDLQHAEEKENRDNDQEREVDEKDVIDHLLIDGDEETTY